MLAPPDPASRSIAIRKARRSVAIAATALESLAERFTDPAFAADFDGLVTMIHECRGRVVTTGLARSGIVARKIAATFIATGTQATYLHPGDAGLGDIGIIEPGDIVLMVSRTGSASELAPVLSYCRRFDIPLVLIASSGKAEAARFASLHLHLPRVREATPLRLTPTTSTAVQLVFGDALAMAVMQRRGFSQEDFHVFHPSGKLGAQLLKISDVMTTGKAVPRVGPDATLVDATMEMTRGRFGCTAVVDSAGRLVGAFTDGDLRRTFTGGGQMSDRVGDWMTPRPSTIGPREFASEALRRMQGQSILTLFVVDGDRLLGLLHMHDVLAAGTA